MADPMPLTSSAGAGAEFLSLPVIDISPLLAPAAGADVDAAGISRVVAEIGAACKHVGFFYVTGHGVSSELQQQLQEQSAAFFSQPQSTKMDVHMNKGGRAWRGFFPVGEELTSGVPDMKEGLYFGAELPPSHPLVMAGIPMHGANLFPSNMPLLRDTVLQYIDAMTKLGHILMGAVSLSLGLDQEYFRERYLSPEPLALFRIFNYPRGRLVAEDGEERWGVGEHTDYGVLTILKQDSSGGLQVKNRSNDWVQAPPVPDSFVINIGDMLEKMTAGLYRSTPHRVKNLGSQDRLSFPFFFDPNFAAVVEPVPLPLELSALIGRDVNSGAAGYTRWDGAQVEEFRGTYGEYILRKVLKVFPDLAKEGDVEATVRELAEKVKAAQHREGAQGTGS